MLKTVKLALSQFPKPLPDNLLGPEGAPLTEIEVNLGDLFHHYYLDSWGMTPPNPDPAHFEHVQFLLPSQEFRFSSQWAGLNKTFKGNKSNELGQAFCRWFLSEHLGIDYIAHLDAVRDHGALAAFGGISVKTSTDVDGDRPDFFCASGSNKIFLAEAKGTGHAVGFTTKEFATWREQFERVEVFNALGHAMKVKGFIVAMRWATEYDSAKVATKLSAEDPETRGELPISEDRPGLAFATKSIHYASTLQRLRQPLLSAALLRGTRIPDDLSFQFVVWQCLFPGLEHYKFVGGYYPGPGQTLPFSFDDKGRITYVKSDPLRLDVASGTFFGVEARTMETLVATAREGPQRIGGLRPLERPPGAYSALSFLRDGHIVGPIELFRPINAITL
ncbi:MAG: hypothetical protein J0I28_08760 [Caulobacterales bacterium]|nr:hypothetical protein [Caulobacterales bacterium]